MMHISKKIRVLAIASGGGHWVQLMRLRPAWDGCDTLYVTTSKDRYNEIRTVALNQEGKTSTRFHLVVDANRWEKLKLLKQLIQIVVLLLRERPDVIVSTGASIGFFALRVGKWLGARTIWVDSIANVEQISLSGEKSCSCADLWLTQWEHLATPSRDRKNCLRYEGSVI